MNNVSIKPTLKNIARNHKLIFLHIAANLSIFLLVIFWFGFSLTNPSDPSDYINSVINKESKFNYPDRLLLWFLLRFFYWMGIEGSLVAPVTTTFISLFVFAIAFTWLAYRFSLTSATFFSLLMHSSPAWIGVATYTYPMHGVALCSVLFIIVIFEMQDCILKNFLLGIIAGLACLFKIQGFALLISLLGFSIIYPRRGGILYGILGFLFSWILVFVIWVLIDDANTVLSVFEIYFSSTGKQQWHGRGVGGVPPYWILIFEPSYMIATFGIIYALISKKNSRFYIQIALVAVVQIGSLMMIYIITGRGGPIITNYVLDFVTVGFVLASIIMGETVKKINEDYGTKINNSLTLIFSTSIVSTVIFQLISSTYIQNPLIFLSKFKHDKYGQIDYVYSGFIYILSAILIIKLVPILSKLQPKEYIKAIKILVALTAIVLVLNGHKGALEAISRSKDSNQYHNAALIFEEISSRNQNIIYSLTADFGQGVDLDSRLLNRTIQLFYPKLLTRLCNDEKSCQDIDFKVIIYSSSTNEKIFSEDYDKSKCYKHKNLSLSMLVCTPASLNK